ncbi:MAG: Arc family DNA-binding protein [Acinetobacter sp.]
MGRNLADVEYKMRMTQDLKDKIVASAKEHNRSMNADIITRLEKSFENESFPPITQADKDYLTKIQAIEEKLDMIINNTDGLLGNKKAP